MFLGCQRASANMAAFQAFHNSWAKVTVYAGLIIHQLSQFTEICSHEENTRDRGHTQRRLRLYRTSWNHLKITFTLIRRRCQGEWTGSSRSDHSACPVSCFIEKKIHWTHWCIWRKISFLMWLNPKKAQLDPKLKDVFSATNPGWSLHKVHKWRLKIIFFKLIQYMQTYWIHYPVAFNTDIL